MKGNEDINILRDALSCAIPLGESFFKYYLAIKSNLPYHINLIDQLKVDERAHSEILTRFLEYQDNSGHPFFESFIKHIGFDDIKVVNPWFKVERDRIDVSVVDSKGNYALIIENKIKGAPDQTLQIERYINAAKIKGFSIEQIYVIYLSNSGGSPKEYSLSHEIKQSLGSRYKEISYKYEVITWLQDIIKPRVSDQDVFLNSALQQYLDHLYGMFHQRNIHKAMNRELIDFLEKELDVQENTSISADKIKGLVDSFNITGEYLALLLKLKWLKYWEDQMKTDFEGHSFITIEADYDDRNEYPYVGLLINHKRMEFWVGIEFGGGLVYGISVSDDKPKNPKVETYFRKILKGYKQENEWWYGSKASTPEEVYNEFRGLVNQIIEKITK